MRTRDSIVVFMVLILANLLLAAIPSAHARHGPREDDMAFYFYDTQAAAYGALITGDIDIMLHELTSAQATAAFANPGLVTCRVPDLSVYEFDLNNNYSIAAYPGIRSPMNYSEMRQAVAYLSDKDYYVNVLLGGLATRVDQMIAAPLYGWANESMSYPNYPYEFDPAAASAVLNTRFPQGTTPNLHYDPGDPLSSPYLRQYPADHPQKPLQDLDPLIFYVRMEHNARRMAGCAIYEALRKMGVPIYVSECPSIVPVMGEFNYHFYTGGWSVGRFPPISLYGLYHSINAFPYGSNYVTGADFNGVPGDYQTHPKLDDLLYAGNYAGSYSEAVGNCKLAAGYMTEICVNVPLWSVASYWAWSTQLLGVVNKQGEGPMNQYTFMQWYKADGSPIRCGVVGAPHALNIVYSNSPVDYLVLDRMNLYGGLDQPAYNVALDQAGFVTDWETTTWDDGGTTKTKVIMSFRDEGYTAKPVSGDVGENINANTYFWNAWLDYQVSDCWGSTGFIDLHHVVITAPYDFEIYFDTYSYWNTYYCQGPLRPMNLWMAQGPSFIDNVVETITAPTMPGAIPLANGPIWFDSVTAGGTPLTFMVDYNIIRGDLYILTPQTGDLVVDYWYVPSHALRGYTPGNLPWQTILEGGGMYYCTAFTAGVGGSITFKRNPFYYMVTPPLGEIDYIKKTSGPYAGNYVIDLFDLALFGQAYGSKGTGVPDPRYLPGADIAPRGGVIDIFDVVTLAAYYGKAFDPIEP